jgi:hypothetical protein
MAGSAWAGPVRDAFMVRAGISGRAGAGGSWGVRARPPPPSIRFAARSSRKGRGLYWPFWECNDGLAGDGCVGGLAGETAYGVASMLPELAVELALAAVEQNEELAAVEDESADQFIPCFEIHLLGDDAEVEADVDEHGADRAAAVLGGNFLGRGQADERGALGRAALAGRFGDARVAWGGRADADRLLVATGGEAEKPGFERGGAEQTTVDAGEDQGNIAGAEDAGNEGETGEGFRVVGVLLEEVGEVAAVGDERADEAENLADARGHGPIGGIGVEGGAWGGGCVGHGRNRSTK